MVTRYIRFVAFLPLFIMVIFFSLFEINDSDTIQYLASGKYITEHGLPQGCVFTYTTQYCDMAYPEWLFHVVVYSIYRLGSWVGLGLFQVIINFLIFGLILVYNYKRKYSFFSLSVFFILGLFVASDRTKLRADLLALLFSTLLFIILESFINKPAEDKRKTILLHGVGIFLIMMLWANIHGSFPLGFYFIGVFIIDRLISNIKFHFLYHQKRKLIDRKVKLLLLIFIFSVFGSLLNPFGLKSFFFPYHYFWETRTISYIAEHQSPFLQGNSPRFSLDAFQFMGSIGIIILALSFRVGLVRHILLYTTFLIFSIAQVRNFGYFAVLSMLILPRYGDYLLLTSYTVLSNCRRRLIFFVTYLSITWKIGIICFTIILVYLIVTQKYYFMEKRTRRFGFGISRLVFPHNAIDFIKKNNPQGNIFNSYSYGSFINWALFPAYKSSIHGHMLDPQFFTYYSRVIRETAFYNEAVKTYGINTFFLNYTEANTFLLVKNLYSDPDWKLVYLDPTTVIFIANIPEHTQLVKEYAIDLKTSPIDQSFTFYKSLSKEDSSIMHSQLATFYYNFGLYDKALFEYRLAFTNNPQNYVLMANLGKTYFSLKKYDEGENILISALKINPQYDIAHAYLARIYQERGDYEGALEEYKKALKYNPLYKEIHFHMGSIYLQIGNKSQARMEFENELLRNPNYSPAIEALKMF